MICIMHTVANVLSETVQLFQSFICFVELHRETIVGVLISSLFNQAILKSFSKSNFILNE